MRGLEDRFARPPRMCEAGVELIDIVGFFEGEPSKADPIFRGSKLRLIRSDQPACRFQSRPDLQGVKTSSMGESSVISAFQSRPDLQGVKTC